MPANPPLQTFHHLNPKVLWEEIVKWKVSVLPRVCHREGNTIVQFSKAVQDVFKGAVEPVAGHFNHPKLTDMIDVLLRKDINRRVGAIRDILQYHPDLHARPFVKMLKTGEGLEELLTHGLRPDLNKQEIQELRSMAVRIRSALGRFYNNRSARSAYQVIRPELVHILEEMSTHRILRPLYVAMRASVSARRVAFAAGQLKRVGRAAVKLVNLGKSAGRNALGVAAWLVSAYEISAALVGEQQRKDRQAGLQEAIAHTDDFEIRQNLSKELAALEVEAEDAKYDLMESVGNVVPFWGTLLRTVAEQNDRMDAEAKKYVAACEAIRDDGIALADQVYKEALEGGTMMHQSLLAIDREKYWLAVSEELRKHVMNKFEELTQSGIHNQVDRHITWVVRWALADELRVGEITTFEKKYESPSKKYAVYVGRYKEFVTVYCTLSTFDLTPKMMSAVDWGDYSKWDTVLKPGEEDKLPPPKGWQWPQTLAPTTTRFQVNGLWPTNKALNDWALSLAEEYNKARKTWNDWFRDAITDWNSKIETVAGIPISTDSRYIKLEDRQDPL
ncbi:MAG: hypothetical protein LLG01_01700 [Planctomycetaceae bacterium]|nr:hypothetical protein [Planctomycetaceae bacterium]